MKKSEKKGKPDYFLLGTVILLFLLGILVLASVSMTPSQRLYDSPTFLLFRHLLFGLLPGVILGFLAFRTPLSKLKKWAPRLLLVNIILLLLVFFPGIGIEVGGASRWINLWFASFQPSELLKITFVLYLAAWLSSSSRQGLSKVSTNFFAFLIVVGIITFLLVRQPDVSTWGIIMITAALMYFLSGIPIKYALWLAAGGTAGVLLLIKFAPYRFDRLLVFLKPDIDPMGASYQIKQAVIAVGSGGLLGKGLGMSLQKYGFLPQPMADSIFAVFSEETGLLGGFVLIALFLIFAWRGFTIAKGAQNEFAKLVCVGLTSWIVIQAFVNMGAMLGLLPLTGIPLPFISYGGSALTVSFIAVGLLLNVSCHAPLETRITGHRVINKSNHK